MKNYFIILIFSTALTIMCYGVYQSVPNLLNGAFTCAFAILSFSMIVAIFDHLKEYKIKKK